MGDLRDQVDVASAVDDHRRAAEAGGPRRMARSFGRTRGADRFPASRRGRRHKRRR